MAIKVGAGFEGVSAPMPGVPVEPSPKHAPSTGMKVRHLRTLTSGVDVQEAMRLVAEFAAQYPTVELEAGGTLDQAGQIKEKFTAMQLGHDDMETALKAGRETLANAMLKSGRVAPTPAHRNQPAAGGGFCSDCVVL